MDESGVWCVWRRMLYRLRWHFGRCDLSRWWQYGACSCGRLNSRGRVGDRAWGCGRLNLRLSAETAAAGGTEQLRGRTEGPVAVAGSPGGCCLKQSSAEVAGDWKWAACFDYSRNAAAAFAASVSHEGWPNWAGEVR